MEAELVQLAREAVAALQAGPPPNWAETAAVFVSAVVGFEQIGVIMWGLSQMNQASEERNRQLDQQGETLGKIGQALDRQGEVLAELLRRTA